MSIFTHGDSISTVPFGANCLIKNFILFYFFKLIINYINITGNFSSRQQFRRKQYLRFGIFDWNYKKCSWNSNFIRILPSHPTPYKEEYA